MGGSADAPDSTAAESQKIMPSREGPNIIMKCVVVPDSEKAAKVGDGKGREGKLRKGEWRGRKRDGAVGKRCEGW